MLTYEQIKAYAKYTNERFARFPENLSDNEKIEWEFCRMVLGLPPIDKSVRERNEKVIENELSKNTIPPDCPADLLENVSKFNRFAVGYKTRLKDWVM